MRKVICDCCGKDITDSAGQAFSWLCHLTDVANGKFPGYADFDGNPVSGREDSADLCNKCYNDIVIKAVSEYFKLKNLNENPKSVLMSKMDNLKKERKNDKRS